MRLDQSASGRAPLPDPQSGGRSHPRRACESWWCLLSKPRHRRACPANRRPPKLGYSCGPIKWSVPRPRPRRRETGPAVRGRPHSGGRSDARPGALIGRPCPAAARSRPPHQTRPTRLGKSSISDVPLPEDAVVGGCGRMATVQFSHAETAWPELPGVANFSRSHCGISPSEP
jgi:hypothetical protein